MGAADAAEKLLPSYSMSHWKLCLMWWGSTTIGKLEGTCWLLIDRKEKKNRKKLGLWSWNGFITIPNLSAGFQQFIVADMKQKEQNIPQINKNSQHISGEKQLKKNCLFQFLV